MWLKVPFRKSNKDSEIIHTPSSSHQIKQNKRLNCYQPLNNDVGVNIFIIIIRITVQKSMQIIMHRCYACGYYLIQNLFSVGESITDKGKLAFHNLITDGKLENL